MATSRVPAVLDALVAIIGSALTGEQVQVLDGPQPTRDYAEDLLIVGVFDPEGIEPAATSTQAPTGGLGSGRTEEVIVRCSMSSWRGSGTVKERRDRVSVVLGKVEGALRADKTLGGVVQGSGFGLDSAWSQGETADGPVAEVVFTVAATALI